MLSIYFIKRKNNNSLFYVFIKPKLHLMNDLKVNILVCNNMLKPKNNIINISCAKIAYI